MRVGLFVTCLIDLMRPEIVQRLAAASRRRSLYHGRNIRGVRALDDWRIPGET